MDLITSLGAVQSAATFINYSAGQVALNIIFAFVLASLVALVYQLTHKGYSYSKNFVTSLILISVIATFVMMIIGNSLARAFALLGTFSIIRFRTALKDTKDISFVFLALVLGMAAGTNNYVIGIIATILILLIILFLDRVNITGAEKTQYTLSVFAKNKSKVDWKLLDKYLKSRNLLTVSTRDNGKLTETVFAINFRRGVDTRQFVEELTKISGIEKVHLFSTKEEIEY